MEGRRDNARRGWKEVGQRRANHDTAMGGRRSPQLPLVVALNCLEDCRLEAEALAGIAMVEHVGLLDMAGRSRVEMATTVIVQSLAFLPRSYLQRMSCAQLIICIGSSVKAADTSMAEEHDLRLVHVDKCRFGEVADTVMALILGMVRRTHVLASRGCPRLGFLGDGVGELQGSRRCRGLMLGLVGIDGAARALARRAAGFGTRVLYWDLPQQDEGESFRRKSYPVNAERVDSLKELLSSSDVVSLHCPLIDETKRIINEGSLKSLKHGAILVNTCGSHLIDDCALKQALNTGLLGGVALDGVDGPQWLEAWVREMPNVLILPHSAEYSEEVWTDIRTKAVALIHTYLVDGTVPDDAVSKEDEEEELEREREMEKELEREMELEREREWERERERERLRDLRGGEKRGSGLEIGPSQGQGWITGEGFGWQGFGWQMQQPPPLQRPPSGSGLSLFPPQFCQGGLEEDGPQEIVGPLGGSPGKHADEVGSEKGSKGPLGIVSGLANLSLGFRPGLGGGGGEKGPGGTGKKSKKKSSRGRRHQRSRSSTSLQWEGEAVLGDGAEQAWLERKEAATAIDAVRESIPNGVAVDLMEAVGVLRINDVAGRPESNGVEIEGVDGLGRGRVRTEELNSFGGFHAGVPRLEIESGAVARNFDFGHGLFEAGVLRDGVVVALRSLVSSHYYVARHKGSSKGWHLEVVGGLTAKDPSAQFLVVMKNKERVGFRSMVADGKLLQANKKLELVFMNHNFDLLENWNVEAQQHLGDCLITNRKFQEVSLKVAVEILAAPDEADGIIRWIA